MARRAPTLSQGDLFQVPRAPEPTAGSLAWDAQLRAALSQALKETTHSRDIVAARMSELLGEPVTKARLDSWTAESKDGHRFPLAYLPAFETATETYALTRLLVSKRGCTLCVGEEAIDAEVGRLEHQAQVIKGRLKALKTMNRGGCR